MNDKSLNHPSRERLLDYGLGKLDPNEAHDVETHIADCDQCGETLIHLQDDTFVNLVRRSDAVDVQADDPAVSSADDFDLPAALQDHPRYHIVELLGRGGMGDVYKAEHKVMNRPVALKLINRQLIGNPQAIHRFRREVQAAARLSHPNIVTAHDAEQAGDSHFLVMEFVDGTDLDALVKQRGPLTVKTACDYIRQAADGLQHAHESGMVHRDIKPQNLMLSSDGQVRILDFGLAGFATESAYLEAEETAAESASNTIPLHLTAFGSVMGTPDYIAPEQARDAHSADIRADIYSLGCTLSFLLTGKAPFDAATVIDKLKAHAELEPPRLSNARDDVSAELQEVLDRMLAKDPAERFQTPAEVADALAGFVDRYRSDGGGPAASTDWSAPKNPLPITFALSFVGTLSTLSFVLVGTLFMSPEWLAGVPAWMQAWLQFGGMLSLPVGVAALVLADRSERKNSHRAAVKAGLLNLLPVNPFVVVLLPLTVWTLLRLRRPSARLMYEHCPPLDRAETRRRWPLVITTVACLVIAFYASSVFLVHLGSTTLRFEIDDPTLAVRFRDETISTENDRQAIYIKPGRKQEFVVVQNGVEVETDSLTLRKGDKVVLRVSVTDDQVLVDSKGTDVRIDRNAHARQAQPRRQASDKQSLQGTWRILSVTVSGDKLTKEEFAERTMTFSGDRYTGPKKRQPLPGKFVLDATTDPKQIDLHFPAEQNAWLVIRGIYRLEGDTLTICMQNDYSATRRPTDFTSSAGDKRSLQVLGRVSDKELIQGTWKVVALAAGGQNTPEASFKDKRFLIKGDKISLSGKAEDLRPYRLDPAARPKTMDIPGSVDGQFAKAIYQFEGDALQMCFSQSTKLDRPKDFNTAGTKYLCFTLKREKP